MNRMHDTGRINNEHAHMRAYACARRTAWAWDREGRCSRKENQAEAGQKLHTGTAGLHF